MLRVQMFGGVNGDELAELAAAHPGQDLADNRHRAHDEANEEGRGLRGSQAPRQLKGFLPCADNRLFGEDGKPGGEGGLDMSQAQMVG
jgi:hypothetical protein